MTGLGITPVPVEPNLYLKNNIRYDPLGDYESLGAIGIDDVHNAHEVICRSIRFIVILSRELPYGVSHSISKKVSQISALNNIGTIASCSNCTIKEPEYVSKASDGFQWTNMRGQVAIVLAGLKLKPLYHICTEEHLLSEIVLVNHIMSHAIPYPVETLSCRQARSYMMRWINPDPRFFWDPSRILEISQRLRESIIDRLNKYKVNFSHWTHDSLSKIIETQKSTFELFLDLDILRTVSNGAFLMR